MQFNLLDVHFSGSALAAAWLLMVYGLYLQGLVVRRIRANEREASLGWWLGGALSLGTAIWAESLLGLIALRLPIKVGYVPSTVLLSWLPSVAIGATTVWVLTYKEASTRLLSVAAGLLALGVGMLTWVNGSAMVFYPGVIWQSQQLVAGVVTMALSMVIGFVVLKRDLQHAPNQKRNMMSAVLAGTGVRLGQTLLIMAAGVPVGAVCVSADRLSADSLEFVLTATVLLLLLMVHMGTIQDAHSRRRHDDLERSLQQAQAALDDAVLNDMPTGLLNRLGIEQALRNVLSDEARAVRDLSVLRLNLDGFKVIVETYGHDLGDTLMRHQAARLKGLVREGDVLSRTDTDEFLLMCKGLSDEHQLVQLAQRLSEAVSQPCYIHEQDIALSCSIGIATYPSSNNAGQLLSHSRDAMLTARKAGGGVYCFYETGMDRVGAEQIEMQRDLRHAIARQELTLYFQPKLRATDGTLAGVEALLRWEHPQRGMVSPVQFIPVAERFGLIGELGLWVLEEACRHIRLWHDEGLNIPVAVNLSVHQLRQPDLEQRVREALKKYRVPPHMLIMEITESAAMEDIDYSLRVFDMLDAIGVRLSIDDFGTGYSSLSYLRRLPARQLKIDRSFVRDLESSLDAQAIVEAVVRLSHALGLKVVAEGVETEVQSNILARLHCDELQGFLFARPMPAQLLLAWLSQRGANVPVLPTDITPTTLSANDASLADADTDIWPDLEAVSS
jgi:diguanylate cyclase (GGDEF)-like protein